MHWVGVGVETFSGVLELHFVTQLMEWSSYKIGNLVPLSPEHRSLGVEPAIVVSCTRCVVCSRHFGESPATARKKRPPV